MLANALRGANLKPCQIHHGAAASEFSRVQIGDACLDMVSLGPAMLFSGAMPSDCFTLVYVTACPQPGHSFNFGMTHSAGYMGVFAPGGVVDAKTPAGYQNAILTIPVAEFHASLAAHFPKVPDALLARGAGLRVAADEQARLGAMLDSIAKMIRAPEQPLDHARVRKQAGRSLRAAFLAALRSGCEQGHRQPNNRFKRRYGRLRQARDFIAGHLTQPLCLDDLCVATGLSRRGVENLFTEFLGIGPIAYLRNQRLHGAHRDLRQTGHNRGAVKRIALTWGFPHFGHFAADYRSLFGESPTQSLSRAAS